MRKVLAFLLEQDGPVFASDIRNATGLPSGSLSPAIARFEAEGIVRLEMTDQKWHDPAHGFQLRAAVFLTADGRAWGDHELRRSVYQPDRRRRSSRR